MIIEVGSSEFPSNPFVDRNTSKAKFTGSGNWQHVVTNERIRLTLTIKKDFHL